MNNSGALVESWVAPPPPEGVVLEGRYARLEKLEADVHAAQIFRANSQDQYADTWRFLPYGPFSSVAAYHHWVRDMTSGDDPMFYAIKNKASGHFAGVASFLRIKPEAGSIEVGHINLASEMQRSQAATEAIFLMMQWAFTQGYRRFEWKCDAANLRSRRAAERFGFSYEGVFRQHSIVKGRNRDTAWFACIDAEWPALKEAYSTWLSPANFDAEGRQLESLADFTALVRSCDDPELKAARQA